VRLDLIIPTWRRPALLRAALESVARADPPRTMTVEVVVVNNDDDPELPGLDAALASMPFRTSVLHEPTPGKSSALNAAIARSTADYVGLIDDDEEIDRSWFRIVERALGERPLDFLGGRALPLRQRDLPSWLPANYPAVLGMVDGGPEERPYGPDFPGIMSGGNAVIARTMFARIGGFSVDLGPRADRRLFSCEDEDMYWRLVDAGAQGRYVPDLVVYHYIHPERLRKRYYRSWSFWNSASKGVLSRRRRSPLPSVAGVPRYLYGEALAGLADWVRTLRSRRADSRRFSAELTLWHLAGRLYGRHFARAAGDAAPSGSAGRLVRPAGSQ
jgi:glycosyltransferase involved in cell wall biosynthesis